jgi:hypothetical protein
MHFLTKNNTIVALLIWGSTTLGSVSPVLANETTMTQRNRELMVNSRYDPSTIIQGLSAGYFTFYPSLTLATEITDNLYSVQTNKRDDIIYKLTPALFLKSDFERHAVTFSANAEQSYHQKNDAEDRLNYSIGSSARYDLTGDINLPVALSYEKKHTVRGTPDDEGALEPTPFEILTASTGFVYNGQVINFDTTATIRDYSFEDTQTGAGLRNNQDRNRTDSRLVSRLGLGLYQGFIPYVYNGYRDVSFDDAVDDAGFRRSARELEGGIGARFDLTSLATSTLQVGYVDYKQDDARFSTINDLTYLLNVNWEPTTLLGLSLTGQRNVEETSLTNASASVDTSLRLSAKYELTPYIFLLPSVEFLDKDYQELASTKLERTNYGFDIDYRMSDNLWWNAKYTYTSQEDPDNSPLIGEYKKNNFMIFLKLQF